MTTTTTTADRPAVRRFVLVTLILPLVLTVVAVVIQLLVLPTLPDPVAIHWNAAGRPNGFGPVWLTPLLTVVVGLGIPALIAATALSSLRRGDRGFTYRLLGAVALATSALMAVLGTWTTVLQSGLDDAADGPAIGWALVAAFVIAAGAGVAGWLLQPHEPWQSHAVVPTDALQLAAGERAVWLQSVSIAPSGMFVLGAAVMLMIATTVMLAVAESDPAATWIMLLVTIVLVALVATCVAFHVRIDDEGIRINSVVGWPRVHVPLADVESAAPVFVSPMGEFGGWGLRWAAGRFGVVLRTGEGIEVRRRGGKTLTVTVDDAETGAALLNALAARAIR